LEWKHKFGVEVIRDRSRILLPTPRVISALRKVIKKNEIELIWFGAAAPLGISAKWLRLPKIKRIVTLTHGHEIWWAKIPPFSWLMRFSASHIDNFGYLGSFTAKEISRVVPSEKLIQIAPGIDVEHFRPRGDGLRRELNLSDSPVIVSVGRLVHRKGQDRLLEALSIIKDEYPDITLLLIGEGPYRKELEGISRKLKLTENVKFLGRVAYEDLPNYLSVGDFFVMPARTRLFGLEVEGLGIVYLEASACGLPVIVGNSGGAPDAVRHGETGFVVNGKDVREIAERSLYLLRNEELRFSMSEQARLFAENNWDWDIWAEEFNKLLKITATQSD
jgi:phosphatidylinositol alpha-1,6-mannosyltransferase